MNCSIEGCPDPWLYRMETRLQHVQEQAEPFMVAAPFCHDHAMRLIRYGWTPVGPGPLDAVNTPETGG